MPRNRFPSLSLLILCVVFLASPLAAAPESAPGNDLSGGFFGADGPAAQAPPAIPPFTLSASVSPERIFPGGGGALRIRFDMPSDHKVFADSLTLTPRPEPGIRYGEPRRPSAVFYREADGTVVLVFTGRPEFEIPFEVDAGREEGPVFLGLTVNYQGCAALTCYLPREESLAASLTIAASSPATDSGSTASLSPGVSPSISPPLSVTEPITPPASLSGSAAVPPPVEGDSDNPFQRAAVRFGMIGALAAAFFWGFLASLTPCVYPMIPVTVSVIGASGARSVARGFGLSVAYVLGMSLTYALFGLAAALSGTLFGAYAGHPVTQILVGLVFTVLALGMFDVIHLQVPSRVSGWLGGASGGGVAGVFLTGAASGAVVGPCVGPMLVGLLVYVAGLGDALMGFLLLWSFSLGMGMLFLVIGTFSGAAASLPRSGEWMISLRQVFGFLMLGAALYYVHPLLSEEAGLFLAGWLLTGAGVTGGAWSLEKGGEKAGEPVAGWRVFFKSLALVCLVLGLACVARVAWHFPLKAGENRIMSLSEAPAPAEAPGKTTIGPAISWFDSEDEALNAARTTGKPVLVDFRADWCAACRKLEAETFPDSRVSSLIRDRFIALRIDGTRTDDPAPAALQRKYGVVGLPTIVFLTPDGRRISGRTLTQFVPPEDMIEHLTAVTQEHGARPAKP